MATCSHPERTPRTRGLCRSCYSAAQRKGEFKDSDYHFAHLLIHEAEFFDDLTWDSLSEMFGRTKKNLKRALKKREDLISRIDKNSGIKPAPRTYVHQMIRVIEADEEVTWTMLAKLFGGQSKESMRALLYRQGRTDLARQVNTASKNKHSVTPDQWWKGA